MAVIPDLVGVHVRPEYTEKGGIFFTPSNTAKQNYMYLQCAGSVEAGADYSADLTASECYMLLYTYSGSGELRYQDKKYTVGPNEGFLVDCRQSVSYRCVSGNERWAFVWFHMNGSTINAYFSQFASVSKPIFWAEESSDLENHIRRLALVAAQRSTSQSELIASTAIISILTELILKNSHSSGERKSMPGYIDGIIERINTGYASPITLDQLASEFNVSKFHLSREFKKYTGYSPNEYLISVRINRAKELLRRTNYSVNDICQITGCGDVNHFIQLFKSREKITPAAFRKHWQA